MTLIEITNKLKHYATNQFNTPTVLVGSLYENMNTKELKYPVINLDHANTIKRNNELVYNFYVYYADRLNEDGGNLLDVQSQGTTSLQLLLRKVYESGILNLDELYDISINTYKMKFADVCGGAYMQISVHTSDDINYCDVPQGTDTITITRNGEYDVALYEKADVNVLPSGGTIEITENGTYDVTDYTTAEVNVPIGDYGNYFYFQSRENGSKLRFRVPTNPQWSVSLEYSTNKINWTEWDFAEITLDSGATLFFRGNNPNGFNDSPASGQRYAFQTQSGSFNIGGDIRSLIDKTMMITTPPSWCFMSFFRNGNKIVNVDPKLLSGFSNISNGCFSHLFMDCSLLENAPELPWTIVFGEVFNSIFRNCVRLTTAPDLPAKRLEYKSYSRMFYGCSNLNYIKLGANERYQQQHTRGLQDWVNGVSANGIFIRDYNATELPIGNSGIPSGWTVLVDNVPESVIQQ